MRKVLKKSISVVLVLAVMLSMAAFCVSGISNTTQIIVQCSGEGSVSDGKTSGRALDNTYNVGDTVTLSAMPDDEYEFLFWKNKESDRILSFKPEYTFTVGTYMEVEAVFDYDATLMAEKMFCHTVIYVSGGDTVMSFQTVGLGDSKYDLPAENPFMAGVTWTGWDLTPGEVASMRGRVYVYATYSGEKSYTVSSMVDGVRKSVQVPFTKTVTVTAPQTLRGEDFSYWVVRGKDIYHEDEIVSYQASYSFVCTMDVTVEAVYGEAVTDGAAIRVAGDDPNFDESTITFYAEHSVTDAYTVLEHGLMLTLDVSYGNSESKFVLGADSSAVIQRKSSNTLPFGTYYLIKGKWNATMISGGKTVNYYPLIFARAYMIVQDSAGNVSTRYSSIYCADYVNETFTGVIEGDNYPDPFG